jgi:hypothetical protein
MLHEVIKNASDFPKKYGGEIQHLPPMMFDE